MSWTCLACQTSIRQSGTTATPLPGVRYRCHVCRVTLRYEATIDKLIIVAADDDQPKRPKTRRK